MEKMSFLYAFNRRWYCSLCGQVVIMYVYYHLNSRGWLIRTVIWV